MKKYLFIICIVLFFSCKDNTDSTNTNENINNTETKATSLQGAWELTSFLNYREDGSVDTINSSNSFKQMKMYSETKVMWSRLRTMDSLDWFGVGDYTFKDGILTEVLDYGSKAMNSRIKSKKNFIFNILLDKDKFTQIEFDSIGKPIYAENYLRVK
ncbi:hypothetical protein [Thalassobellus suaedae]|uniref:Lipocalin-like domain-containing protein n=1 Tax=Thalassobellus suaedae TaxID=3074124 RepID=A0ABY9XU32_9FLAO|nr:hypothetical protein RHP51_01290 [Flavobacteriaceae bacterium HL-DH14]WNH11428.1 hypothetical protein RHP49_10990 [Flavobacteriaceae bacterium HL-DH10]